MESYRTLQPDLYCAVVFKNNKTGKIGLVYNSGYKKTIKDYWKKNEKGYTILEVKEIKNTKALKFFVFWGKFPKAYYTEEQMIYKFDFLKYVCGAELSEKYRGLKNINERSIR